VDAAQPRAVPDHKELTLVHHGDVGWLGTADRFPAWAEEYFRIGSEKLIRKQPSRQLTPAGQIAAPCPHCTPLG